MRRKRFLARLGGAGAPAAVAALLALAAAPTHAQPHFGLPVDCPMGAVCVVQNYMDDLPGPEAQDYRGGALTYEGHKGTDIRVPNLTYVERGVAVIAAGRGQGRRRPRRRAGREPARYRRGCRRGNRVR